MGVIGIDMWNIVANLIVSIPLFLLSLPIVFAIRYYARRIKNQPHTKIEFFPVHPTAGWTTFISIIAIILIFTLSIVIYEMDPCAYDFLESTMHGAYSLLPVLYTTLTVRMLYIYF